MRGDILCRRFEERAEVMEKFPVTTNFGVYKVKILEVYVGAELIALEVKVYIRRYFWGRIRFKKVYKYKTSMMEYEDRRKDLKGLAIDAVHEYEEMVRARNANEIAFNAAIKEFEEWDGRC